MYAVIKVGGKQQRVKTGDVIEVEKTEGADGSEISFQPILVVDDEGQAHLGKDLEKATVAAKLVGGKKGEKITVVKYKNKTRYTRHNGHRQLLTVLEVGEITLPGGAKKAAAKPAAKKDEAKAEPKAEAPETPVAEGETDIETEGGE
jgi:large subunit ribosomal protein L21